MNCKKHFSLCLLALGLSLSACGSDDEGPGNPDSPDTPVQVNPEKVFTQGLPVCDAAGNVLERDAQGRVVKLGDFASFDYVPSGDGAAERYDATVTYSLYTGEKSEAHLVFNPQGFVSRVIEDLGSEVWHFDFAYSAEGQMIRMTTSSSLNTSSSCVDMYYENGDLVRCHGTLENGSYRYDSDVAFVYTSTRYPSGLANRGRYVFIEPARLKPYATQTDRCPTVDDVLYYAGLLGHTTARLPLQRQLVGTAVSPSGERTDTGTALYTWTLDDAGYPLRCDFHLSGVENGQSYSGSGVHNYHWR